MKKIWKVGDAVQVSGDWDSFFKIRNEVEKNKSLASSYLQSSRDNEAIELFNSDINRLNGEIRKRENNPTEGSVSLNLLFLMITIYSDLVDIYCKKRDTEKLNETLSILAEITGKDYQSTECDLLGLIFERMDRLELAEHFYEKVAGGACWHAFRVACLLGHKDFALKMIDKYIEGDFKYIGYDVWGEYEVNKSAFTVWLLENESDYRLKMFEDNPKSIQTYLVYGMLLEGVGRYSDALNIYKDFVKTYSKTEEQTRIINESKEMDTTVNYFGNFSGRMAQTGKFNKTMWDVLMSYFNNKVSECGKKCLMER